MGNTALDVYRYSKTIVVVLGILGNILVVISILRQKKLLKNNYYFSVFHLAICDLGVLIFYLIDLVYLYLVGETLYKDQPPKYCAVYHINYVFHVAGIGMMLIISVLRYRATVHPLKPDVSRRKLKLVCGLMYVVGVIAGYGSVLSSCFLQANDPVKIVYQKVRYGYVISCFFFFPTLFIAVVYYKIGRELVKQNRYMKNLCSNSPERRSTPGPSFNILKVIKNQRIFSICLITVLCYGIGNISITVYIILEMFWGNQAVPMKYVWIEYLAYLVRIATFHSVNPLIYGRLDKKLLTFWKR